MEQTEGIVGQEKQVDIKVKSAELFAAIEKGDEDGVARIIALQEELQKHGDEASVQKELDIVNLQREDSQSPLHLSIDLGKFGMHALNSTLFTYFSHL